MLTSPETETSILAIIFLGFAFGAIFTDFVVRVFDKKAPKLLLIIGGIVGAVLYLNEKGFI